MAGPQQIEHAAEVMREAFYSGLTWLAYAKTGIEKRPPDNPVWEGGIDKSGRRRKSVWPGLAEWALNNNLPPLELVKSLFKKVAAIPRDPVPQDLKRDDVVFYARSFQKYHEEDVLWRVKTQQRKFVTAMTLVLSRYGGDQAKAALMTVVDRNNGLSPLTRFIAAVKFGLTDLVRKLHPEAMAAYSLDKDANEKAFASVWGVCLAAELVVV